MAIIKCYECNKDISDTISNCIHCGALNNSDFSFKMDDFNNEDVKIIKKKKSKTTIFLNYIAVFILSLIYTVFSSEERLAAYELSLDLFIYLASAMIGSLLYPFFIAGGISAYTKKEFSWQFVCVCFVLFILGGFGNSLR